MPRIGWFEFCFNNCSLFVSLGSFCINIRMYKIYLYLDSIVQFLEQLFDLYTLQSNLGIWFPIFPSCFYPIKINNFIVFVSLGLSITSTLLSG